MSESLSQKYDRILGMCEVGKQHGAYTQIACPVKENHKHGDAEKSASLGLHSNGISFKCFIGCQTDAFLDALELTYKDLFPDDERIPTNIYSYHNADGSLHHDKIKYRDLNGKKTFKQRTIDENGVVSWTASVGVPYAYPQLIEAIRHGKIEIYGEGEKDCNTAKILGFDATTMGGASDWKDEFKNFFKDANLVLIPDKDDAGLRLTGKMVESLKPVCKSLKILVLPIGKDLTEWVEAGNSDLQTLINSATELTTTNGVPEPVVKVIVGGYELYWIGLNIKVIVDHIQNGDDVEIAVYENEKPLYISGYKLLSVQHKASLARSLQYVSKKINWDVIVNQITVQCLSRIREGEPIIYLGDRENVVKPEYLIDPLFPKNMPSIIYAERSSAKSLFLALIDILLTIGWYDNPFELGVSNTGYKVLMLDWENDQNTVGWQIYKMLNGLDQLGIELAYLHCSSPLVRCLPQIQQKINEINADVVIIDSLAVAVGGNTNDSEPALNFFGALRQLPVTPLIIAHTAKDKNNKTRTVYGNAFYENLARSIWEVSKFQALGASELTLSLYQRKTPPFSGYHQPIGFRFSFDGDKILVNTCNPAPDQRDEEK